eukprot:jgi/Ulvmu1/2150/UM129_0010.1
MNVMGLEPQSPDPSGAPWPHRLDADCCSRGRSGCCGGRREQPPGYHDTHPLSSSLPNPLSQSEWRVRRCPPLRQPCGPYLITTPDGVTIPLPQLGSQRSRQSDRPAPPDARDLRQYSTANDIPAATFAHTNSTWLQAPSARCVFPVGSSPRAEAVRSPAPRRGSVQLHGQLSLDEGRAGRSTEGHSMHGAACTGAQPTLPPGPVCTAFDVRPSAAGARTRQTWARVKAAAQAQRGGKAGVRAASEKNRRGRSGVGQCTTAAVHAGAGNNGPQHAAQHVVQHGSGAAWRGRAADNDLRIHSMLRAAPTQSDRGGQQAGAGGGAAAEVSAAAVADAANERAAAHRLKRASTALIKVCSVLSALHPHSTQHGSSIGPQTVSVAQGSTPATAMLPLGRVSLPGERLRAPSPQHMAGSAPAARPNPDVPASLTRENLALCADLPDQSTQRGFNTAYSPEIWPICTPQHGAQHGDGSCVRAVRRGPYSVPQPSPQHSTQRSPQLQARHSTPHATYLALPGLPQMDGGGADSSSSSSLNTPPQDRTLGVQPPSTTRSVHHSTQRGAQRQLPQVSLSGGIVASPGFPAE